MYLARSPQFHISETQLQVTGHLTIKHPQSHLQNLNRQCYQQKNYKLFQNKQQHFQAKSIHLTTDNQKIRKLEERIQQMEQRVSQNIFKIHGDIFRSLYETKENIKYNLFEQINQFDSKIQKLENINYSWQVRNIELKKQISSQKLAFNEQKLKMGEQIELLSKQILEKEKKQKEQHRKGNDQALKIQQIEQIREKNQQNIQILQIERKVKNPEKIPELSCTEMINNDIYDGNKDIEKKKLKNIKNESLKTEDLGDSIIDITNYEKLVDTSTKEAKNFLIKGNSIKLEKQKMFDEQQILLNTKIHQEKIFKFEISLESLYNGCIYLGVTDRIQQRGKTSSFKSGNAIALLGNQQIYYGQDKKVQKKHFPFPLKQGMKVEVQVDKRKGTVKFIAKDGEKHFQQIITSDILMQPNREFVPYFEMIKKGTKISWTIE